MIEMLTGLVSIGAGVALYAAVLVAGGPVWAALGLSVIFGLVFATAVMLVAMLRSERP